MSTPSLFDPFEALEAARRAAAEPSELSQELSQRPAKGNHERYQEVDRGFAAFAAFAGANSCDGSRPPVREEEEEDFSLSFQILTRESGGSEAPQTERSDSTLAKVAKAAKIPASVCEKTINCKSDAAKVSQHGLRKWRAGLERMAPDRMPCPGYRYDEWARVLARCLRFLDLFGEQAEALGWTAPHLFGVHPVAGIVRVDACGALVLPSGGEPRLLSATEIQLGHLTHREKPGQPAGILIWEFDR
ncbi:hypothetical protein [Methylobacterium organophilum]|uniref:Uncharacterized protein n=1 Tax=Methylobacterium organophilum TaxID=410 RepID=A0ABQ4TEL7_METOR|nr:hypothetical protein [Methylobacterium organophilum]GJE29531.1 hypothetical protein LKMONMHP_4413 [Methylobacterium organophilum]